MVWDSESKERRWNRVKYNVGGVGKKDSPADAVSDCSVKMRFQEASWNTGKTS